MDIEKVKEKICRAIGERKVIEFDYKDKRRVAEPYICGISAANKYVMLAYQTGGHSSTGKFGWKLFEIANIKQLKITADEFVIAGTERKRYDPIDKRIRKTFCAVPR
jgi:hypothetical protein